MWRRDRPRIWVFCDGGTDTGGQETGKRASTDAAGAGCAAVARAEDGAVVEWAWRALPAMTNNEAEYAGLLLGLELARRLRADEVVCLLDSATVVGQMNGRLGVNSPSLRQWHRRAWAARRRLGAVRICYVPREWNCVADALARQARLPWDELRRSVDTEDDGGRKEA